MCLTLLKKQKIGKKIGVFPIYEYWKDVGSLKDYVSANKKKIKFIEIE